MSITFVDIIMCLAAMPTVGLGSLLFFRHYFKTKHVNFLLGALIFGFGFFFLLSLALCLLLSSITIFSAVILTVVGLCLCMMLYVDSISKESVDSKKIVVVSILSGAWISAWFYNPDILNFSGELSSGDLVVYQHDFMILIYGSLFLFQGVVFAYYTAKIYANSPKKMKKTGLVIFIGAILWGIISIFFAVVSIAVMIFIIGVGASMISLGFNLQPKLGYILPFKVLKLTVIATEQGIPLYTHTWSEGIARMDESLFSGMMNAIDQFVMESLKKGMVQEIHLQNAILILRRHEKYKVVCVLVVNKSTKVLKQALNSFAESFFDRFAGQFAGIVDLNEFKPAADLAANYFPFIPDYIE